MKRLILGVVIAFGGALLGGCPVYSNSRYCDGNGCYDCPPNTTPSDGTCIQWSCGSSSDCGPGYVCDPTYTCVPAAPTPEAGTSSSNGCGLCPSNTVCKLSNGFAQCAPIGGFADAGRDASSPVGNADSGPILVLPSEAGAANDAGVSVDASHASDAAPAPDASSPPPAPPCNADQQCAGDASKCIDGHCVAQGDLCSDTTQCVVAGEACVNGVCVPHCDSNTPCAAGYACDFTRSVCDLNPTPCTGSGASTCVGGSVCVEGRCAAPCATGDAGPACPTGQLCVNGGCIPDEAARFACKNDGQSGLLANECAPNQICVHHDCYAACDPTDGGTCGDTAFMCKEVTVPAGTYAVCGGASNLGSDCDPATGKLCATGVCVDGFCR